MSQIRYAVAAIVKSLVILSLSISLVVLTGQWSYRLFATVYDVATPVGLSKEQLFINIDQLMYYLISPFQATLSFANFSSSAGGLQHFVEVKRLMQWNFMLSIIGIVYLIWSLRTKRTKRIAYYAQQWLKLTAYFPLILLFFIVIAFDKLFVLFHQLFFRNDLWLFNPNTDPIINVLPQSLFMMYFVLAIVIYEVIVWVYRKSIK
ncbi:TIGR01906 family membrane protein [Aerococcaceae bacterium zg-ZUI334]|uniref:TIGR01906 family membrane protein n=1 Tax=Aerococcaceae bacterium zg-252 TaxID=2796928 RepID=UPI001B99CA8C|nr:TIGR01906 family membrane protein [Aerococcaceae bacterium zg-ZUI334]